MPRARKKPLDADWVYATFEDAAESLTALVAELETAEGDLESLLQERLPAVYAKLNYAWNSRRLGAAAHEEMDHDVLIGWPVDLPINQGG